MTRREFKLLPIGIYVRNEQGQTYKLVGRSALHGTPTFRQVLGTIKGGKLSADSFDVGPIAQLSVVAYDGVSK